MTVIHHDFGGPSGPPASGHPEGAVGAPTGEMIALSVISSLISLLETRSALSDTERRERAERCLESAQRNLNHAEDGLGWLAELRFIHARILQAL